MKSLIPYVAWHCSWTSGWYRGWSIESAITWPWTRVLDFQSFSAAWIGPCLAMSCFLEPEHQSMAFFPRSCFHWIVSSHPKRQVLAGYLLHYIAILSVIRAVLSSTGRARIHSAFRPEHSLEFDQSIFGRSYFPWSSTSTSLVCDFCSESGRSVSLNHVRLPVSLHALDASDQLCPVWSEMARRRYCLSESVASSWFARLQFDQPTVYQLGGHSSITRGLFGIASNGAAERTESSQIEPIVWCLVFSVVADMSLSNIERLV